MHQFEEYNNFEFMSELLNKTSLKISGCPLSLSTLYMYMYITCIMYIM